jgi:hypothetical protein
MRVWLDDVRSAPEGWIRVHTAAEAIGLLEAGGVEFISLDHDLGDPEAPEGYAVAAWLEEQAAFGRCAPVKWAIHSANPVGRARMETALRRADDFWRSDSDALAARFKP